MNIEDLKFPRNPDYEFRVNERLCIRWIIQGNSVRWNPGSYRMTGLAKREIMLAHIKR